MVELRQGVFTQGSRFINMLPTRKLLERIRLSGLKVLDIGTMEGAFSVMASRAGANVVAYDRLMLGNRAGVRLNYYGSPRLGIPTLGQVKNIGGGNPW